MRTLVITDLHYSDKPKGLLASQKVAVYNIVRTEMPDEVIIMGDLMMHRKPPPSVLLALKETIDMITENFGCRTIILRGNHDSETKADDGVTSLSLFENPPNVFVITQTTVDHEKQRVFIPHYEDETKIKEALDEIPDGYSVFGHFGYRGALNSAGDSDFSLKLSDFRNPTLLGHVHRYVKKKKVTILGTPYTTNFGEAFKDSYYGILEDGKLDIKKPACGPRHLIFAAKDLPDNLEIINDPNWFTMLRVLVGSDHHPIPYDQLEAAVIDVKYNPIFNEEDVSSYEPERDLFTINEIIIEDYVDNANSTISKEILMEGYRALKDED